MNDRPAPDHHAPELLEAIIESAPVALLLTDAQGRILLLNREAERLFAYPRGELLGQPIEGLVPVGVRGRHADLRRQFVDAPRARRMGVGRALSAVRKDGSRVPVEIGLTPLTTGAGLRVLSVVIDLTERQRLERRFELALESAPIAMLMVDAQGSIVLVNRQTELLFGYQRDELLGKPVALLMPSRLQTAGECSDQAWGRTPCACLQTVGLQHNGQEMPVEVGTQEVLIDDPLGHSAPTRCLLTSIVDITERVRLAAYVRRAHEELEQRVQERTVQLEQANRDNETLLADLRRQRAELERLSREDPLTGLANRRDFDQQLRHEVQRSTRTGSPLTVAMLDLDHFKHINDRLGHTFGDAVLRAAAGLIRAQCREFDLVARYGGEEFALIMPGTDLEGASAVCERIRRSFQNHEWSTMQAGLLLTISAGLSQWQPGVDMATLLMQADAQLYEAKRLGRNRVQAG